MKMSANSCPIKSRISPECRKRIPRFLPAQFKTCDVRRQKVNQKQTPDDVSTGKPGDPPVRSRRREEKKQTLEITIFCLVDADVNLIKGTEENQDHRTGQTDDGQLERGERFQPAKEFHSSFVDFGLVDTPGAGFFCLLGRGYKRKGLHEVQEYLALALDELRRAGHFHKPSSIAGLEYGTENS